MVASQKDLLEQINSAMKAMTVSDFGTSILTPEASERFIRVLADSTPLLQDARLIVMNSHTRNIDRLEYEAGFLRAAADAADESKPARKQNQLIAAKVRGIVGIEDDALEDNIERDAFEQTLLEMIANRAGFDLENLYLNGDTSGATGTVAQRYMAVLDGWMTLAGNSVDETDFDATKVEEALEAALQAVPKKHIRNRTNWRFGVHWDIENAYRDVLRERGTGLGDSAQTGDGELRYKGIPVKVVPNMAEGAGLLYRLGNPVYGVYRDVRIEPDRIPTSETTNFVVSARVDAHYENEDAAVAITGWTGPTGS
jgi:HK97 family phage major capsid protein